MICFSNDVEGIGEQDIERLFERFFTVDRTRSNGSTGLGLTIVKELVEKMNGKLDARLEAGRLSIRMSFRSLQHS